MKIQFVNHLGLIPRNKQLLTKVNEIINIYSQQGYQLTLRQLYYQLVTRNIVVNNSKEYDKLNNLITKGRLLGIVDWNAIVDRTRSPKLPYFNHNPEDAINDAYTQYRLDRQLNQKAYVELWVEKDALSAVLMRKTSHYHIHLMVNRGYSSTTAMYDSYNRILRAIEDKRKAYILYLGDHDPSGLDMVRDIYDRIVRMLANQPSGVQKLIDENYEEFGIDELLNKWMDKIYEFQEMCEEEYKGTTINYSQECLAYIFENFEIRHIGLTTEQVRQYNPPPNPAKMTDPRADWYVSKFGRTSWEVDALEPAVLHQIIDDNINQLIDIKQFNAMLEKEKVEKEILKGLPDVRNTHEEIRGMVVDFDLGLSYDAKNEKDVLRSAVEKYRGLISNIQSKFN